MAAIHPSRSSEGNDSDQGGLLYFSSGAFDFSCLLLWVECRSLGTEIRLPKPRATLSRRFLRLGVAQCCERAGRTGEGSKAHRGRRPGARSTASPPAGLLAQDARDEGGEPGAPLGPKGAVGLRRRGAGATLPGRAWPQPGWLGGRCRRRRGSSLQSGRGGGRRAGAVPAV